ncbi:hypothetical protein ACIQXR_14950 [Peribacillus sp. NPDC097224]|uniref:hypothetical protein n=1 Tax=unclassified Peribacillus TaxID=2675266 RepID=UPI00382C85E1
MKKFMIVLVGAVLLGGCNLDNDANSEAVDRAGHVDSTDNTIEETGKEEVHSSYTVADYIKSVEGNLEANSDALIERLKKVQTYNFYSEVELLDFVADRNDFYLSITMFSMDRGANEVFYEGKDSSIFSGSVGIVEDVPFSIVLGNEIDDFWSFYEENDEELDTLEKQAITKWFAECWEKANGEAIELPSYFCFHDEYESFDLKKKEQISDDEKWAE